MSYWYYLEQIAAGKMNNEDVAEAAAVIAAVTEWGRLA